MRLSRECLVNVILILIRPAPLASHTQTIECANVEPTRICHYLPDADRNLGA